MASDPTVIALERRLSSSQLERRKRVLDVAREIASETGYDGLTMQAVADRSGITRMTVYRYFASKDALLAELVHPWSADIEQSLRERPPGGESDGERVGGALARAIDVACDEPRLTEAVLTALLSKDPAARRATRELAGIIQGYIEAVTRARLPETGFGVLSHVFFSVLISLALGDIARDEAIEILRAAARACFSSTMANGVDEE